MGALLHSAWRAANLGKWFDCCVVGAHGLCHLNDLCVIAHSSALASPTHAGLLLDVCRIKRLDGGAIGTSSLGTEDRRAVVVCYDIDDRIGMGY